MLEIKIDESVVQDELRKRIAEAIQHADFELVFWDAKELMRRTCMSWNFIQQQFFFDPRFPKRKIGSKWYFPAREARKFLEAWLNEQPRH